MDSEESKIVATRHPFCSFKHKSSVVLCRVENLHKQKQGAHGGLPGTSEMSEKVQSFRFLYAIISTDLNWTKHHNQPLKYSVACFY